MPDSVSVSFEEILGADNYCLKGQLSEFATLPLHRHQWLHIDCLTVLLKSDQRFKLAQRATSKEPGMVFAP